MSRRFEVLLGLAAGDCLSKCCESAAPLVALADYLDELRDRGWDEEAVKVVERSVVAGVSDIVTDLRRTQLN